MAIALQTPAMIPLTLVTTSATMVQQSEQPVYSRKRQRTDSFSQPSLKIRRITSSLPSRFTASEKKQSVAAREERDIGESVATVTSPHDLIASIRADGGGPSARSSLDVHDFFLEHTEEEMQTYAVLSVAVRSHDLATLRRMHDSGVSMRCSNKFGESLIHMACRRGYMDVVKFLVQEAGVSIRVRDDFGRTPLHDACWTCEPNEELMELLLVECPELLMMSDKRGHTPFQYARKEHWSVWNKFLESRKELIRSI